MSPNFITVLAYEDMGRNQAGSYSSKTSQSNRPIGIQKDGHNTRMMLKILPVLLGASTKGTLEKKTLASC